ncbi:hypothetical protein [Pantoea stewartii]|uniref:Uncharacterized protein n=1 Tax=Pantoea stewartii subsp. stewartii DC283 TaxID=660596 RepID=H3R9S0_PANSE|nr:hypothetical protein [Pantoea stewartii]ARF51382.1 hypothetical protein DSJ_20035 [Pantoea stewartii subsp. stewartii DC283]EHU01933.1 hypothetical protein CKS_0402 [Pantoea stewartii subsp. stewartii DC283]
MAGKLIEINPNISLRAEEITATAVSGDRSRLIVHTRHHGVLEVTPLQGETPDMARQRIFSDVNTEADNGMQLIEITEGVWLDPADVAQITQYRNERDFWLIMRGNLQGMHLDGRGCSPADIAARINTVMRERRMGLGAI